MNPLTLLTTSSSFLLITLIIAITFVCPLPIEEGDGKTTSKSRIAIIQAHFPAELNSTLGSLLKYAPEDSEPLHASLCYTSHSELNIFNRSLPFSAVVHWYYLTRFPSKPITTDGISRLLNSTANILSKCSKAKTTEIGLQYGFTVLSDKPFPYLEALQLEKKHGGLQGSDSQRSARSSQCVLPPSDTPLPLTFDWRDHQVVTPVRSQQLCGSCWLFASMAALESALLLHESFSGLDPSELDLAEQQLVMCSNGCKGAEVADAYEYILQHGITFEKHLRYDPHPYSGYFDDYFDDDESSFTSSSSSNFSTSTCSEALHRLLQDEEEEQNLQEPSFPPKIIYPLEGYCWLKNNTDQEMKRALLTFGPLYVSMNAEDAGIASAEFDGGVVNASDCNADPLNHSVLLVGYTEVSWLLKNSWSRHWNGDGYFEVAQGREMCGINREMAWPLLKKKIF